jgi:hypothetical protein
MEIPKYLDPEWLESLTGNEIGRLDRFSLADSIFPDNTILKLKKNGDIGEYIVKDCRGFFRNGQYEFYIFSLNGRQVENLQISYNKEDEMELPIIKNQLDYEGVEPYRIILDINPEWLLQLSRLRLALAMSLNERLGENSSLKDVSEDIITSIGENIEKVVGERPLNDHKGGYGGGKKKKRKSKKRRKTKRKKSKRKKYKSKRRKS